MIELKKISKIKKKSDLKKYKIDEPIFISNYLFHYLIMVDNIDGLKLVKHPIYKENDEGLQGFHLAAKIFSENSKSKSLKFLLDKFHEYSGNKNYFNETFIDYLKVSDDLIKLIKIGKKVNWKRLFIDEKEIEDQTTCYLDNIFLNGTFKLIDFILNEFSFNWEDFKRVPFFKLCFNKNLNSEQKINILSRLKKYLNLIDFNGKGIIYYVIESSDVKLLKFLYKNNIEFDKYIPIYTLHPFIFAYELELINKDNKFQMSNFIWNKIKDTHNFLSTNKFGENIAFSILKNRVFLSDGNIKLEEDILNKNDVWDKVNINKETILNALIFLPFKKYKKFVENKELDVHVKNKSGKSILDLADGEWYEFLKEFPKNESHNELKIKKYRYSDHNSFSSTILDTGLFFTHLDNKYKNLLIPKSLNINDKNLNWEGNIHLPHPILTGFNNYCWVIYWRDKNNYNIHPELNNIINSFKNRGEYDCAALLLSLRLPHGGLHAELIYYDFINNTIERFDPYGNSYDYDPHIDEVLEEELTWNTGFDYINVKKFLPVAGLQTLSDESNFYNEKPGDFGGYCLAWCLWYLEHRILNCKLKPKKLVPKMIDTLLKKENSLMEYIRNYANSINKQRLKILERIGIDSKKLTNLNFTSKEEKKIFDYISKKTTL